MQTAQVSRSAITHLVGTTAVLFGGHDVASSSKNRVAGTAPAMCARPSILLLPGVNAPVGHVDLLPSLMGEYVTWAFSPNNNGIAHQGPAG
jgi:hypothetical protein